MTISRISAVARRVAAAGFAAAALCGAVVEAAQQAQFVVIRNLNPPQDCRVVPADAMYIAIYAQVFGPARKADAEAWAQKHCPPSGR